MSILGREIITLQFGSYSNYIGTHWWNLQEAAFSYDPENPTDINNDTLFREGQTVGGEVTFTPRLVLADLHGSLGTLPGHGGLYEETSVPDSSLALWDQDKIKLEINTPLEKNEFLADLERRDTITKDDKLSDPPDDFHTYKAIPKRYNLDNSVSYWSDYLKPLLHPRSLAITNQYKINEEDRPFNCFGLGTLLWKLPSYQEDLTERIRGYMEEADNLQGFHVLLDGHDGFSGLACGCLQYIRDEYTTKAVLSFLGMPSYFGNTTIIQDTRRVVNLALAVSSLPDLSSVFCPISTVKEGWRTPKETQVYPYLNYDAKLNYHTSAILAAGLETLTLSYRLRNSAIRLADVTSSLRVVGRAASAASVSLPFPMLHDHNLMNTLESWNGPLFHSMTPYCNLEKIDLQSICIRGVQKKQMFGNIVPGTNVSNPAYSCRSVEEMLRLFISCDLYGSPPAHVSSSEVTLKTSDPFPSIFNEDLVSSNGKILKFSANQQKGVDEAPAMAGLHSTKGLGSMLETLHYEAKRINLKQLHGLADSGIELLDWQEKLEQMLCLSECYTDN